MPSKARHFDPKKLLKNIYHAIFSFNLSYGCQIWSTKLQSIKDKIFILQKKAVHMTFADFRAHNNSIFHDLKLLKTPLLKSLKLAPSS